MVAGARSRLELGSASLGRARLRLARAQMAWPVAENLICRKVAFWWRAPWLLLYGPLADPG